MKPTQKREKFEARSSLFEDSDRNSGRRDGPASCGEATQSTDKIYGLIPVLEALRSGQRAIDSITIAEGARHDRMRDLLALAKKANVPVHRVPRVSLDRSLKEISHQGVVARTAPARYRDADELLESIAARGGSADQPLVLGLDGIEDPRNFGAILRTAECAGVHGVFIPERRAVGLTDTVAKAAAGAVEYVPIARATNLVRLIEQLKERNICVVGATAEGTSNYTDWDWTLPSAIFIGGDGAGLQRVVWEGWDT